MRKTVTEYISSKSPMIYILKKGSDFDDIKEIGSILKSLIKLYERSCKSKLKPIDIIKGPFTVTQENLEEIKKSYNDIKIGDIIIEESMHGSTPTFIREYLIEYLDAEEVEKNI